MPDSIPPSYAAQQQGPSLSATSTLPSSPMPKASQDGSASYTPGVGETILRQYADQLDPLDHKVESATAHDPTPTSTDLASPTGTAVSRSSQTTYKASRAFRLPKSFLGHRRRSTDVPNIPTQTILKALVSKATGPPTAPMAMSMTGFRTALDNIDDTSSNGSTSPCPTTFTTGLNLNNMSNWSPTSAMKSPCFFHQRFDGIVDIQKVLDEMSVEDEFSHSRLTQTANGVREVSKQLQRRPLKRAVRTIMIVTKARDNSLVHLTRELAEWLLSTPRYGKDAGVTVYVDAKLRQSKRFDAPGLLARDPRFAHMLKYWTPDLCWSSPEKFDLVLTLGGDGTVLFTSWLFQRITASWATQGMRVNLRMRFTCTVWRQDTHPGAEKGAVEEGEQFEVLNEMVIDRGPSAYVSNLELYGDDELLTIVQADGCIFSTPTGSTAYSLSAGGSLIHPSIPAILLTPICPHSLSFRPMVLSDTLSLRIAVPQKSRSSAYASFDGKGRIELKQGDYVTLEASQYPFPTVMAGGNEWVESVQRALRWNVRGAEQKGWDEGLDGEGMAGEQEKWDIDIDNVVGGAGVGGTDSGLGQSEDGDGVGVAASPSITGKEKEKGRATLLTM
ncbi:NAD(+) kinase [Cyphellophora attinorum]|uniref:NAD(+) kinase n=1 Tax=Cyphellophora attinorum TaxID=1664694 RepID=A0A0N0NQG3_9EURO|nr:NAD(+) kinase [Phialophora attinorum]KPI43669.1 NAD(+) kinase [Phialophora attinorum]